MPTVAYDLERHPLVDGADRARVDEQRVVGVAVDVDEAGSDELAGRVELLRRRLDLSDPLDPPVRDRDVGADGIGAGAVEDGPVSDDQRRQSLPRERRLASVPSSSTAGGSSESSTP